jgi:DNA-binding winged helix-turn-helix (wHTH) protein
MNSEFDPPSLDQERECILFGRFSYDPATKVLMEGGEIVQLPPKTCELLGVLIASRGSVITKAELMNSVWNGTFVEESNLTHHIAVLRKALKGGDFIETVPRKGYRFAASSNSSEITIKEKTDERRRRGLCRRGVTRSKIAKPRFHVGIVGWCGVHHRARRSAVRGLFAKRGSWPNARAGDDLGNKFGRSQ